MIYTIGGIKGGTGKTTLALNLAVVLSRHGRDVLLVDADRQKTASDLTDIRSETLEEQVGYTLTRLHGKEVKVQVQQQLDKYDDIIIDCGGVDSDSLRAGLLVCDVFLTPFQPRTTDILAFEQTEELVSTARDFNEDLRAYSFLSRASLRGSWNQEAAGVLTDSEVMGFINAPLMERVVYAYAQAMGLSIVEYSPKDDKAIQELYTMLSQAVTDVALQVPTQVQ